MNTPAELRRFDREARLRDGTPVRVRAVRPDDRQRLVAAFAQLDAEAVYTRFHAMKKALTEAELDRFCNPDFERSIVLVVALNAGDDHTAVAAASCNLLGEPGVAGAAEVSFTVTEAYRGRGIAGLLLGAIVEIARALGLRQLEAEVLATNAPMLAVFQASGLPMSTTREANDVHVVMRL